MFRRLLIWSFVALAGLGAVPAHSSRVTPMVVEMTPAGRGSLARIEVANTDGREMPMEIRMYRGRIAENGELALEPADDRFAAFPPQVVVPANGRQVFRIQFIPDGPMAESEIYYASISQLPVELEESGSRIQMLMRFNVLVNVVPEGTTARPVVESARWVDREVPVPPEAPANTAPLRERGLEVRIVNRGNRYFPAGRIGWQVTGTDQAGAQVSESFAPSIVSERIGMGIVAPGQARVFFMPMDRQLRDPGVTFSR
jgi:fimbrial chaperone protein